MKMIIASYEGGGYSETEENKRRSAQEWNEIVNRYMSRGQLLWFRLLLVLSLAPLRTRIAESRRLSGIYNRIKEWIYQRRG